VKEAIDDRCDKLLAQGGNLVRHIEHDEHGLNYWVRAERIPEYHG